MKTVAILEGERVEVQEHTEYTAFGFDVDKQEYIRLNREVESEMLCRSRLIEAEERGWLPGSIDFTRIIFRKRRVVVVTGEWEVIKK